MSDDVCIDGHGNVISCGDIVVIKKLPEGLSSGLPEEEATFISQLLGKIGRISSSADTELDKQYIEIEISDKNSGIIHYIKISSADVLKVYEY